MAEISAPKVVRYPDISHLLAAKMERRKALASLPVEAKFRILERMATAKGIIKGATELHKTKESGKS